MQESPGEPITARTNVYTCLFIQETSWSTSNTFLTRYRLGGIPNESQHQVMCELQGRRIEVPVLPALVLPVNARRWVLANNSQPTSGRACHWRGSRRCCSPAAGALARSPLLTLHVEQKRKGNDDWKWALGFQPACVSRFVRPRIPRNCRIGLKAQDWSDHFAGPCERWTFLA
jgi:hypothetical protein